MRKEDVKINPVDALKSLENYHLCVFGLRETLRLALSNNLIDKSISGALKINLDSVDNFFKEV